MARLRSGLDTAMKTGGGQPILPNENLFQRPAEYDEMLRRGIRLSGEDKQFFVAGRVRDLRSHLPELHPRRVLDYGCGTGEATAFLARTFPEAEVVGVDASEPALSHGRARHGSPRLAFVPLQDLEQLASFDLCYSSGVFHHIPPPQRLGSLHRIHRALKPGGVLALFENNPWNPGTRWVMSRIPFDRDAVTLTPEEARRLVQAAGFRPVAPTRFLFYFPRLLKYFRPIEPWLARLPLGAQYYVLARKE